MKLNHSPRVLMPPLGWAVLVFFCVGLGSAWFILQAEQKRLAEERQRVLDLGANYANQLQQNIDHVLSASYALAALVRQGGGVVSDFDGVATEMLPFYQGASSFLLAPAGVVRAVVPWKGNEHRIGEHFFADAEQKKAIDWARDSKKLILSGPVRQEGGEQLLIGRLPVFLDGSSGDSLFWGIVVVELPVSSVLQLANLPRFYEQGYRYELAKTDPVTGLRDVVVASQDHLTDPISRNFQISNSFWMLQAEPITGWVDWRGVTLQGLIAFLLSVAFALVAKFLAERRQIRLYEIAILERSQKIADQLPGMIYQFRLGPDGQASFPYASDYIRSIYRVTPEDVREDLASIVRIIHPDDYGDLKESILYSARHMSHWQHEYRVRFPDGTIRWLSNNASPQRESDGAVLWHGFITDVTDQKLAQIALQETEQRFRLLVKQIPLPLAYADSNGRLIYLNDRFVETFGYTLADIPTLHEWWGLAYPELEYRQWVMKSWRSAVQRSLLLRQDVEPMEVKISCKNGNVLEVVISGIYIGDNCLTTFVDITERNRIESKQRLAASVFSSSSEGIIICDANNIIVDLNPAFTRITGYDRADVLGKSPNLLNSGRQDAGFYESMWETLKATGAWHGEIWNRHKSGVVYPELLTISSVRDQVGKITHFIGVFSDITLLKAHEFELERNANYDALTGLPNRRLLCDRIKQAIAHTKRSGKFMAVCFLDLDGFKAVNDSLGHEAGDRLLIEISRRFESCMRDNDTVARLGGDEFAIILQDLEYSEDYDIALRRILIAAESPLLLGNQSVAVSASIGVTLVPQDGSEPDMLLRHADHAMYQAKQAGKGQYYLFSSPHATHWPTNARPLNGPH